MHELGIIVHVAQTVEEVAQENEVTDIASVTLEIGEVSGIVDARNIDKNQVGLLMTKKGGKQSE